MGIRLDDLLAQSEAPVASVQPTGGIRLDDLLVQPDQPVSAASPAASASTWWEQFPVAAEQSAAPMSRAEQQIPGVSRLLESSNPTDSQRLGDTGITPGTAMEFAALHVDRVQKQRQAAGQPGLSQQEQVAIADIYKKAAGQSGDMSNQNFYQQAQQKRFAERGETYTGRIAEVGLGAVHNAGTGVLNLVKTVAPETANRLGEDMNAIVGTDPNSWAGYAGGKGMELAKMAGLMALGGAGMGAEFGAESFGGVRGEAAKLREQGTPVSATKEYTLALTSGGINGLVGAIVNKIFGNSSSFVTKAVQDELLMGAQTVINNKIQGGMDKQTAWYQGLLETALTSPLFTLAGTAAHQAHEGVKGKQEQPVAPTTEPPVGPHERAFQDRLLSEAEKPGRPEPSPFPVQEGEYTMEAATEAMRKGGTDIEAVLQMRAGDTASPEEITRMRAEGERKPARATDILTPSPVENAPTLAESEANLRSMYEKFTTAKKQSQAESTLPEAERLAQGKFADHAAAEFQEGLEKVSAAHGEDVAEDMLARIQQQPAGVPSVETQSQVTNEPIRKNVGNLADVTVAADQGKPSLEQRAKPAIPGEARDWSYTKLKGWAKANGYDISKANNIRSLRLRVAEQRGDSLTDLPKRPSEAWGWNARRLRRWGESNGYAIPAEAKTPRQIKESIDAQRAGSIAYGKEALRQINKGPGERKALEGVQTPEVPQNAPETPEQAKARRTTVREAIAKAEAEKPGWFSRFVSGVKASIEDKAAPIGQLIKRLSPRLFGRTQEMVFRTDTATTNATAESLPAMEQLAAAMGGKGSTLYRDVSSRILSGDFAGAKALLPEGAGHLIDDLSAIRLREKNEAVANGVPVGDIGPDHWPRGVIDLKTLRASLGTEERGQIDAAIHQAQLNKGGPLQTAEQMEVANKVIAGFGPRKPGATGPANARERRIGEVTPEQVHLYADVLDSHLKYIKDMIVARERARFLGKSGDPAKLQESVGKVIYDAVASGELKPEHQGEAVALLHTYLEGVMARPSAANQAATQIIHMTLLGQIKTALIQVTDIAFSVGSYGVKSTGRGIKAAMGLSPAEKAVFLGEVGVSRMGIEFQNTSKLARAVRWVTDHSFLGRLDQFSKEVIMTAAHDKYLNMVKNPSGEAYKSFERNYKPVLGDAEFNATVADYKAGNKTARTGLISFMEVSKMQPTSLLSMPPAYVRNPNLRILWALRSFQVSQLAYTVSEGLRKLPSKVPGERAEGIKTLARFTATMLVANISKDLIYKFLHGEKVKPEDLPLAAVDSILSIVGLSRHVLKQAVSDPAGAALRFVSPPVGFVTDVWKDVTGQSWGKGSRAVRYIPLAGDALYYWAPFGHGYHARKEVAKADFNASLMDMRRRAYTAYSGGDPGTARAWMDKHNELLPAGGKKMVFSDVQYPPRDTSERKASKNLKDQATAAMRVGNTGKARTLLDEYNRNRRSGRLNIGDLRESAAQEEE